MWKDKLDRWKIETLDPTIKRYPERKKRFSTHSDMEVERIYGPSASSADLESEIGMPGEYPFTRGVQPTMYRGKLWTMRQFAGFGSAADTNLRFHYLLKQGQTGLSTAFDLPTLMGYDSDSPYSRGEVGKEGVAIDTLEDMETVFKGIPLDKVTTSITINCASIIMVAMLVAVAENQGIKPEKIGGTSQNDMFKEFIAQKEWIIPPKPSLRLVTDQVEWCTTHMPRWNTISISGYHIREAGATAIQELAFTIADGIGYVQDAIDRGIDVDDFAGRLSFFFDVHNDFLEEIAKFRAARRLWAKIMRERFKAKKPRSWMLRTHAQTAGVSLTAQQPHNNIVRVTLQALAAILGGTNSLHTNSMDETYALPTEQAVTIALRTQQVIAEESGVANIIDPLGGSWAIEALTDKIEKDALIYIDKIDNMGGILHAIEIGYPQKEIADAAYSYQIQIEKGEKSIVGINKYQNEGKIAMPTLKISDSVETTQRERLSTIKKERDNEKVQQTLSAIHHAATDGTNTFPAVLDAVKAYASVQEICDIFRDVWGEYTEPSIF